MSAATEVIRRYEALFAEHPEFEVIHLVECGPNDGMWDEISLEDCHVTCEFGKHPRGYAVLVPNEQGIPRLQEGLFLIDDEWRLSIYRDLQLEVACGFSRPFDLGEALNTVEAVLAKRQSSASKN